MNELLALTYLLITAAFGILAVSLHGIPYKFSYTFTGLLYSMALLSLGMFFNYLAKSMT